MIDNNKNIKIRSILKNNNYKLIDNSFWFMEGDRKPEQTAGSDLLGRIQHFLKSYGNLYYYLLNIFSPIYKSSHFKNALNILLQKYNQQHVILNLGAGPTYICGRKDVINIDVYPYDEVDLIADVVDLPIRDGVADCLINIALLEHIDDPKIVVHEMYRILKENGEFICYVPFMVPFHAAPDDFQRWTSMGARRLFSCFGEVNINIGVGPTSGMLWVFQEWLAILLSLGSKTLHDIFLLLIMVLTAPLKVLDAILIRFANAEKIASGFVVTGKKEPKATFKPHK